MLTVAGAAAFAKRVLEVGQIQHVWEALFPSGSPTLTDYIILAVMVWGVLWTIHMATDSVDPGDELNTGAVRKALRETVEPPPWWAWWRRTSRLFSDEQVNATLHGRSVVDRCYGHLQDQAIFSVSSMRRLLRSRWLYRALRQLYGEVMERPEGEMWDPDGYVYWGAMIWHASPLERPEMRRHVKRLMERLKAGGAE